MITDFEGGVLLIFLPPPRTRPRAQQFVAFSVRKTRPVRLLRRRPLRRRTRRHRRFPSSALRAVAVVPATGAAGTVAAAGAVAVARTAAATVAVAERPWPAAGTEPGTVVGTVVVAAVAAATVVAVERTAGVAVAAAVGIAFVVAASLVVDAAAAAAGAVVVAVVAAAAAAVAAVAVAAALVAVDAGARRPGRRGRPWLAAARAAAVAERFLRRLPRWTASRPVTEPAWSAPHSPPWVAPRTSAYACRTPTLLGTAAALGNLPGTASTCCTTCRVVRFRWRLRCTELKTRITIIVSNRN